MGTKSAISFWVFLGFALLDFYSDLAFIVATIAEGRRIKSDGSYSIVAQSSVSSERDVQVLWVHGDVTIGTQSYLYNFSSSIDGQLRSVPSTDPHWQYAARIEANPYDPAGSEHTFTGILNYQVQQSDPMNPKSYHMESMTLFLFHIRGFDS